MALLLAPARATLDRPGDAVLTTRIATCDDLEAVNRMHEACSPASRADRYHAGTPRLSAAAWRHLTSPQRGTTWVTTGDSGDVLAITSLMRARDDAGQLLPGHLELAMLVRDDHQSRGLGTSLAVRSVDCARELGARTLVASILPGNHRMAAILRRLGGLGASTWQKSGAVIEVTIVLGTSR
jgi:RimJ/RimL family protein N-acetyltransferase